MKSQKIAVASDAAWVLTFMTLVWNTLVFCLITFTAETPFWFKAIFVLTAFVITVATALIWRTRILGGQVQLSLTDDPIPHGLNIEATFKLSKLVKAESWSVVAKVEERVNNTPPKVLWQQLFPVQTTNSLHKKVRFAFPSNFSPKYLGRSKRFHRFIILKADQIYWEFSIQARDATSDEMLVEWQDIASLGHAKTIYASAEIKEFKNFLGWLTGACIIILIAIALSHF